MEIPSSDVPMIEAVKQEASATPINSTRAVFDNHTRIHNRGISPHDAGSTAALVEKIKIQQQSGVMFVDHAIGKGAKQFKKHLAAGLEDDANFEAWGEPKPHWVAKQAALLDGKQRSPILFKVLTFLLAQSDCVHRIFRQPLIWKGVDVSKFVPCQRFLYSHDPDLVADRAQAGACLCCRYPNVKCGWCCVFVCLMSNFVYAAYVKFVS